MASPICRNGHIRAEYGYIDNRGQTGCRACERAKGRRKGNLTCTGCGAHMWKTKRPAAKPLCLDCRRRDPIPCTGCGSPHLPQTWQLKKYKNHFCNQQCRINYHRNNLATVKPGGSDYKARAAYFGVEYEYFKRREIFERDRWYCGICGLKVDKALKWPDPMSATLDHVIPMALGGPHTRANTQCAHATCNVTKRHLGGGGEQLALIG